MIKKLLQRLTKPCSQQSYSKNVVKCGLQPRDGKYVYEPRDLKDLDQFEKATEAASVVNKNFAFTARLHDRISSLDGTDSDLNPEAAEIGVKGLEFEGSNVDAVLLGDKNYRLEARLTGNSENPSYIKDYVNFVGASRAQDLEFHISDRRVRVNERYDSETIWVSIDKQ